MSSKIGKREPQVCQKPKGAVEKKGLGGKTKAKESDSVSMGRIFYGLMRYTIGHKPIKDENGNMRFETSYRDKPWLVSSYAELESLEKHINTQTFSKTSSHKPVHNGDKLSEALAARSVAFDAGVRLLVVCARRPFVRHGLNGVDGAAAASGALALTVFQDGEPRVGATPSGLGGYTAFELRGCGVGRRLLVADAAGAEHELVAC